MDIIYVGICIIFIIAGFFYAIQRDTKRRNENREYTQKMLGLKIGFTYKLTNKYNA